MANCFLAADLQHADVFMTFVPSLAFHDKNNCLVMKLVKCIDIRFRPEHTFSPGAHLQFKVVLLRFRVNTVH